MLKKLIITSILVLLSNLSFAGGRILNDSVDAVAFQSGGFFLYANGWGNPNNCTRSNAIVLLASDRNYDKAYALLLAAYASGKKVTGYSDGCTTFDGQTYNTIRGFKYLVVSN
jgi:hypothetical protein